MATYIIDGSDLTDVADAIRTRGGTSALLSFPNEFVDAIENIPHDEAPSGTISITQNGTFDVFEYASAEVNIPGTPSGTISITENGTVNVTNYASAEVNVPTPQPTGTISITENGITNVAWYANAEVNVPGIVPSGTKNIAITQNGTTRENVYDNEYANITTNVIIGDFSYYAYVDVQPSDATVLEASNPFMVIPKVVIVKPLSTPATNKLIEGFFTPNYGTAVRALPVTGSWYLWYPTDSASTSIRTFFLDNTTISIRNYNGTYNWDTTITYRLHFYV